MKRISVMLLILFSITCFSQGFEQNRLENYMYGPFYNDPTIDLDFSKGAASFFKGKKCKTKSLSKLHNAFFSPGLWRKGVSEQDQEIIIVCAKEGQSKALELLEKLVYATHLKQTTTSTNRQIRLVVYDPEFIRSIAKVEPKILKVIPDSHPNYLSLAIDIVNMHPTAYNDVTLRFKRHEQLTKLLFKLKPSYDDIYKHMAIQYAIDEKERQKYVMHNGLLYLELPIEVRHSPYLAYHAFVQNDIVYNYIPKPVIELFNTEGAIMTPRYMTKVTMLFQKFARKLSQAVAPITSFGNQSDELADVVVEIDGEFSATNNDVKGETSTKSNDSDVTFEPIKFANERTVVTDIRVINKIETKKKRRLLNLWRISRFGDNGQVFIAMFRPDGKDNLGAIVVKQNERYMFSDYAAVFSMDGESIWRVDDNGTFSSKTFVLNNVLKSSEGYLNFAFSWKGKYTVNQFNLIDQSGLLIKEFINYYFE